MPESSLHAPLMLKIGGRRDVRLFRNSVGNGFFGKEVDQRGDTITLAGFRRVQFGLKRGSGDYIGWKSVTITPEMVGRRVAVFLSLEAKQPHKNLKKDQDDWKNAIQYFGGIAGRVTSVEEAEKLVGPENEL